ncbi:MAG: hypothetical protein H8E15_04065 [Planctomycetes bacterium]|nr:hypothetical protein [Planctomycetota bacterium]
MTKATPFLFSAVTLIAIPWLTQQSAQPTPTQQEPTAVASQQAATIAFPAEFKTVDGVIDALYKSVSFGPGGECDWKMLEQIFFPGAVFIQPPKAGKKRKIIDLEGFFADFRAFIKESPVKKTGFWESVTNRTSDEFGDVAHSYVIFEARVEKDSPNHVGRGMDSIQLIRVDGRWWVSSINTQFERANIKLPKRFLAKK